MTLEGFNLIRNVLLLSCRKNENIYQRTDISHFLHVILRHSKEALSRGKEEKVLINIQTPFMIIVFCQLLYNLYKHVKILKLFDTKDPA